MVLSIGVAVLTACSNSAAPQATSPPAAALVVAALSGTYISAGKDPKSHYFVEALRLTPTGPGQFSGSFETAALEETGKVSSSSDNVTGSTDGSQVTVMFDQVLGHMNRTGTVTAEGFTLSWLDSIMNIEHGGLDFGVTPHYEVKLPISKQLIGRERRGQCLTLPTCLVPSDSLVV